LQPAIETSFKCINTSDIRDRLRTGFSSAKSADCSFGKFKDMVCRFEIKLVTKGFQALQSDENLAGQWCFHWEGFLVGLTRSAFVYGPLHHGLTLEKSVNHQIQGFQLLYHLLGNQSGRFVMEEAIMRNRVLCLAIDQQCQFAQDLDRVDEFVAR